nr:hypothetical protein [Tanacetum cinerariifolium]
LYVINISRIMSSITAKQTKLELVPKEKRLEIGKCSGRLNAEKIQREPTFQVVLDAFALTPCYSAFLSLYALINKSLSGKTTGATPPKKARKFKKPASPQLTTFPVSPEEPMKKSKRSAKKTSKALVGGVVIRETPEMPLSKKKEKVDVASGKGIELLSEVSLTEEAQYEEVQDSHTSQA